ncbi:MAG: peptide chain release factor N(5)-glutamine methyltransferase [Bacteroidales bacterium]|nr:peptide chain release factor N(5)-glutamine methyltransferase [Bacteroidales bacterium]
MTISEYINNISERLSSLYDKQEAKAVATFYTGEILSLNKTDILLNPQKELEKSQLENLKSNEERLIGGEPVQYVTGTAWFYGLKFFVDTNVLIPRQETEILVDIIINRYKNHGRIKILDIGTGSGCIPVTLKKYLPDAEIYAVDISTEALKVCKENLLLNNTEIYISQYDILSNDILPFSEMSFDVVISNPPYVLNSEKNLMHTNVVDFEPELALYVDDNDPLIFYCKILEAIIKQESKPKELFFEINEKFASEVIDLNKKHGFGNNEIIKDLNGKDRFICGKN